jgi:hypothetical protein
MSDRENAGAERSPNAGRQQRKPYAPPALRRLGSVRDLTHGGGSVKVTDVARKTKKGSM